MASLPVPPGVRAPGWRSDLGLHAALGSLHVLDIGWRCELPQVPDNPFANVLVLRGAPSAVAPGDLPTLFERHFAESQAEHVSVGWDDPTADPSTLDPFVAAGFEPVDDVVLALGVGAMEPSSADAGPHLLRLDLEQHATPLLDCELAVDSARASPFGAAAIQRDLAWRHQLLQREPQVGAWYGAELDGRLLATLGIVSVGGQGRLQSVGTHPNHRNQGIGTALLTWAWQHASARLGLERLVLITARGGAAERFYQRLGFHRIGANLGVLRRRHLP